MAAHPAEQARPEELADAFGLLFSRLNQHERGYRVEKALALVRQGELDPAGIFVVRRGAELVGAMASAPVPGAGGIVWPPTVFADQAQAEHEAALVWAAGAWLRRQGAKLAQCLLAAQELPLAGPLLANGFAHVTWLEYLEHRLRDCPPPGGALTIDLYDPTAPDDFHATLDRTFEQTLDCPEVNGVRTVAEVIAGHVAQGPFDPQRWWLGRHHGEPVGVLILLDYEGGGWEVAYMGVVPAARRRGFGRELLRHALDAARAAGVPRLMLSVDERNTPACELYRRQGFCHHDRRAVLLAVWP